MSETTVAPTPRETGADNVADLYGRVIRWNPCRAFIRDVDALVSTLRAPRPDAASASVTEIPRADLPKLDQPPESPGWRGDATVSAFRARLEVRIRETVDQVARVAGHAPGAKVNLKGFDSFLDCLCDAAAGAALAAAPVQSASVAEAMRKRIADALDYPTRRSGPHPETTVRTSDLATLLEAALAAAPRDAGREEAKRDGFFAGVTAALDTLIIGFDQPTMADDMMDKLGPDLAAYRAHIKRNETLPEIRKYVAEYKPRAARRGATP